MYDDMMLLAERFVLAMESMSQDVKNISVNVYDLSRSMKQLLKEKKERDDISQVPCNEDGTLPNDTFSTGQQCPPMSEHSWEYEQADENVVSHINDLEHEISAGDGSYILKDKLNGTEGGENAQSYGKHITTVNPQEILSLSKFVVTEESLSTHMPHEPEFRPVKSSNYSDNSNSDLTTLMTSFPGDENSVPKTRNLGSAIRFTTTEEPFECVICNSVCSYRRNLIRHMRVHYEGKKYICLVCGKSYFDATNLRRHKRLHTGERPYKCQECGKAFTQNTSLKSHMRSHTRERPYLCAVCGITFTRNNFNKHMQTHVDVMSYKCSECGKEFSNSSFSSHICIHTSEHGITRKD